MSLNEILNWIRESPSVAFVTGLFVIMGLGFLAHMFRTFTDLIVRITRAFTGKYPPPEPVVQCNGDCKCNKPCVCCTDNGCKVGCECASSCSED